MSCLVKHCPNIRRKDACSFYRPPVRDEVLLEQWAEVLKLSADELKKGDRRICREHFTEAQQKSGRLVIGAVPSLFLDKPPPPKIIAPIPKPTPVSPRISKPAAALTLVPQPTTQEHVMNALGLQPSQAQYIRSKQTPPRMSHKMRPSNSGRSNPNASPKVDSPNMVRNYVSGCRCKWREKWHSMNQLRIRQELCDIILISSDQVMFFAHASVLAANSSVLYSTIKDLSKAGLSSSKPRKLMLPSLKSDILGVVVDFIYGISPSTYEDELKLQKGLNTLGFHKSYLPPPPWVNMPQSGSFNVSEMLHNHMNYNQTPSGSAPKMQQQNRMMSNNHSRNPSPAMATKNSYPVMDLTQDDDSELSSPKKPAPTTNGNVTEDKKREPTPNPPEVNNKVEQGTVNGETLDDKTKPTESEEAADLSVVKSEKVESSVEKDDVDSNKMETDDDSEEKSKLHDAKPEVTDEEKSETPESNKDETSKDSTDVKSENKEGDEEASEAGDQGEDSKVTGEPGDEDSLAGPDKKKFSLMKYHPYKR